MAANPLVQQGVVNRLRSNIIIPDFPQLNVTASFLGKEGIKLQLEGESTTYIPTLVGGVISQEPYMLCSVMAELLKSQPLADQFKQQMESDAAIGDITVRGDATQLGPYDLTNCSIMSVRELDFSGPSASWLVTVKGYYNINQDLWG
jgi:hypothetical protein